MSLFYLPGCKFAKYDPKASNKLVSFCKSYLDTQVLGCCSKDFNMPKPDDTVLYVCPTCALIMKESNPGVTLKVFMKLFSNTMKHSVLVTIRITLKTKPVFSGWIYKRRKSRYRTAGDQGKTLLFS